MDKLPNNQRKDPPVFADVQVRALASTGFSKRGIASHFGVSEATFTRWLDEDPDLSDAFANGREHERQTLHNVLYRLAVEEKDKISAMFLLKARHGYREGDQSEQSNRVAITFNLPGALSADQYRTIEAVAKNGKPSGD
jgi:hypothetical protein